MRLFYPRGDVPIRVRITESIFALLILGVLAAILLPVTTGNRGSLRSACLSNVKQLSTATAIYESDNNGALPHYYSFDGAESQGKFIEVMSNYIMNKQELLCHQEQSNVKKDGSTPGQEGLPGVMDYVHCLSLRGVIPDFANGSRLLETKGVEDPAKVTYLRDPIRGYGTITVGTQKMKQQGFLSPHPNGFNVGYLDGHAKFSAPINEFSEL